MKWVLVTGSTDGIGKQTALELARQGFGVILHGRSFDRLTQARRDIAAAAPGARLEEARADLLELSQVRALAAEINRRFDRLDVLVNNAGVLVQDRRLTADGFELHFGVNHLAAFLLTNLLLDLLKRSAPARVVTVSSMLHANRTLDFDNLQGEVKFSGSRAYATSKLLNVLFSAELASRLQGSGVTANSLHPGAVDTKLLRQAYPGLRGISIAAGAATPVYLASSPEVAGVSGAYFDNCRPAPCSPLAQDADLRRKVWELSEKMVGGI